MIYKKNLYIKRYEYVLLELMSSTQAHAERLDKFVSEMQTYVKATLIDPNTSVTIPLRVKETKFLDHNENSFVVHLTSPLEPSIEFQIEIHLENSPKTPTLDHEFISCLYTQSTTNSEIYKPVKDRLVKPEKGKSVIYLLYSRTAEKYYVGKAANYVTGNKLWGSEGRRNSHIYEAFGIAKKGCVHLNNALRKYKSDDFIVTTLLEVESSRINEWEKYFIKLFDCTGPNGFNIDGGGTYGKIINDSTKQKMSKNARNRVMTELSKKKLSASKMGKKRVIKRKNPDDNHLPTHIAGHRDKNGNIYRYQICFPVGVNKGAKHIQKSFQNVQHPEKALELALKYLEELKIEYADRFKQIDELREKMRNDSAQAALEKMHNKNNPPYIKTRMLHGKKDGYFVEGYPDWEGNPYPKKEFTELSCNNKNMGAAKRYIRQLEIKNKDAVFEEYIPAELANLETDRNKPRPQSIKHLPDYIAYTYANNGKISGYLTVGFKTASGDMIKKKFTSEKLSMEEKYKLATDCLIKLINEKQAAIISADQSENTDTDNTDTDNALA